MKNWKPQSTAPVCIWLREHAPVHIIHIKAALITECYSFCHQRVRWHFSMALSASSKGDRLLILDWWHKVEVGDRPRTLRRHSALTLANEKKMNQGTFVRVFFFFKSLLFPPPPLRPHPSRKLCPYHSTVLVLKSSAGFLLSARKLFPAMTRRFFPIMSVFHASFKTEKIWGQFKGESERVCFSDGVLQGAAVIWHKKEHSPTSKHKVGGFACAEIIQDSAADARVSELRCGEKVKWFTSI